MATLTKQQIIDAPDTKTEEVHVPEWGGSVLVKTLSGFERDRFDTSVVGQNGGDRTNNFRARLAAACLVDEAGELLFTEKDVTKLGKKSGSALDRVFDVACRLNRIGEKALEDEAKN